MKNSHSDRPASWEKAAEAEARRLFPEWYGMNLSSDPSNRMFWPPPSSAPLDYPQLLSTATTLRSAYPIDDVEAASKAAAEAWKLMNACNEVLESARRVRSAFEEYQKTEALRSERTVDFRDAVRKIVGDKNDARAKQQFLAYIEAYWGEVEFRRSHDCGYCEPVVFTERVTWVEELVSFYSSHGFSDLEINLHSDRYRAYLKSEILKKFLKSPRKTVIPK
jgi:hypothetical protein